MERANDVLPTPGGPAKHKIGPRSEFSADVLLNILEHVL